MIDQTLSYIGNIFTGRASADQIGGPIWIAQISGQVATLGLIRPASSGGGAVHFDRTAESVPGAACSMAVTFCSIRPRCCGGVRCRNKSQECGFRVGLVLVLMLMVFAFYNDFHQVPWLKGCSEIVVAAFCDVAHWQRLGMKMESHRDVWFAALVEIGYKQCNYWESAGS